MNYVCPGCLFYKQKTILTGKRTLSCQVCKKNLITAKEQNALLYQVFCVHSTTGIKCKGCKRFVPKNYLEKVCPYPNCNSSLEDCKKMRHPTSNEPITINNLQEQQQKLIEIIDNLSTRYSFTSFPGSKNQKILMLEAIKNILIAYPNRMIPYLTSQHSYQRVQHLIFQEYIRLIEDNLPLIFYRKRKTITINNLMDARLMLFDGISTFEAEVDNDHFIHNLTKEQYLSTSESGKVKTFFIGKLLSIITCDSSEDIKEYVEEYTFNYIKMSSSIAPYTKVKVIHLRTLPHYQTGALSYLNRAKKEIFNYEKS